MLETFQGSTYTIKLILKDNWGRFYDKHKGRIRDNVVSEVKKVLSCKDVNVLGYSTYACPDCGHRHTVANTCKSRFCNSCGKKMTDDWIFKAQKSFLNVPYHHIIFSPPEELWLFFRTLPRMSSLPFSISRFGGELLVRRTGIYTRHCRSAAYFRLNSGIPSSYPYDIV